MKIIVAGFSKTGTKSLSKALEDLGFNVYDYLENFWYLGDDWKKILTDGGTTQDFQRMYKDVDVAIDSPVYVFWEELHKAFPDAKIILTLRDEDSWYKSLVKQVDEIDGNTWLTLMQILSPSGRSYYAYRRLWVMAVFGTYLRTTFHRTPMNEMRHRMTYRQHNKYVMETAPKDKLLVYKVTDGWEPLCTFLQKDIPNRPFPHKNIGGKFFDENHPVLSRMKREMLISVAVLFSVGAFGFYKVIKSMTI